MTIWWCVIGLVQSEPQIWFRRIKRRYSFNQIFANISSRRGTRLAIVALCMCHVARNSRPFNLVDSFSSVMIEWEPQVVQAIGISGRVFLFNSQTSNVLRSTTWTMRRLMSSKVLQRHCSIYGRLLKWTSKITLFHASRTYSAISYWWRTFTTSELKLETSLAGSWENDGAVSLLNREIRSCPSREIIFKLRKQRLIPTTLSLKLEHRRWDSTLRHNAIVTEQIIPDESITRVQLKCNNEATRRLDGLCLIDK